MLKIAVKKGRNGISSPQKTWVMLASDEDDEPEYGTWLTPGAARKLAIRLMEAAAKAEAEKAKYE